MSKATKLIRTSGSKTLTSSYPTTKSNLLYGKPRHPRTSGSCARCSGLFIPEHVVGIHFSGFVMRCVNCGATEYLPVGSW